MERISTAIIGGTGVGERLLALGGVALHVPTPLGLVRGRVVSSQGFDLLILSRHSAGHKLPPHRINYRAMALALRALGIRYCLSTAAVGSLRPEWRPGTLVCCSDFLDLSSRNLTLFDDRVEHRDFSEPFAALPRRQLIDAAETAGISIHPTGIYGGLNGPRYETPQEIRTLRLAGVELVGMTASSEAVVMGEAQIEYACLAIVTNLAAGMSELTLDHRDVVNEMNHASETAVQILLIAACSLSNLSTPANPVP